jgi:hypothetical protein
MTIKRVRTVALLLGIGLFLATSCGVGASPLVSIAESEAAFSHLRISPAAGVVQYLGLWTAQTFAQASNSLGELQADFQSSVGGQVQANALVSFATGHASASAATLTASADSHVMGLSGGIQAGSEGHGNLMNSFMLTGGTGAVAVGFAMDLAGRLHAVGGGSGSFQTEILAGVELDGTPILFDRFALMGGPGFPETTQLVSETLATTLTLQFDTPYFLFVDPDSETYPVTPVPEPSPTMLLLIGFGVVVGMARKGGRVRRCRRTDDSAAHSSMPSPGISEQSSTGGQTS